MNKQLRISLVKILLPFGLMCVVLALANSSFYQSHSAMEWAVVLDLLLIVPLFYFLLIRKAKVPNTTVVPLIFLAVVLGTYYLPIGSQRYIEKFKTWILPLIELGVLSYVVFKVHKTIKQHKLSLRNAPDFFTTLKGTCGEILPKKLVIPFATEIAVFYYGFFKWKRKKNQANEFSYHQKTGSQSLLFGFILVIAGETVGLHYLVSDWSSAFAWLLTALSIYSALQVFGIAKSMAFRPIKIAEEVLELRFGILNEVDIPFEEIKTVELSTKELEESDATKYLSLLGKMEGQNVVIELKQEAFMSGFYGIKKKFTTLAIQVDDPAGFVKRVNAVREES